MTGLDRICPLCRSQTHEERFSERGYKVLACCNCELFFIDPYPYTDAEVHDRVIDYDYKEIEILDAERHREAEVQFYQEFFPVIQKEVNGATRILDVGCGTGHFLQLLGRYPGLNRVGIELNKARAEIAGQVPDCSIHQLPIERFRSKEKFNVITMINVLSHVPDFDALFGSIRELLTDNGKLILKVGEMKKNVRKSAVFDWGIPDHLHFLGLGTLNYICDQYGFEIIKHRRIPISVDLFSSCRFRTKGRSSVRNLIKRILLHTPYALPVLSSLYDLMYGGEIYSSLVVMRPLGTLTARDASN